jgi:DNA-directed RNA polymerase subunit RPC12/RpoP
MEQQTTFQEQQDLVCSNCSCEIMVKHTGDTAKGYGRQQYVCSCGQPMTPEHGGVDHAQAAGLGSR